MKRGVDLLELAQDCVVERDAGACLVRDFEAEQLVDDGANVWRKTCVSLEFAPLRCMLEV